MDWEAWRDEFPILSRSTYLNSCSLGALSRRVRARIEHHLDLWDERGASAWYGPWLEELDRVRHRFARLIGATTDEVAVLPNVSTALSVVASGVDHSERPDVVLSNLDFPTLGHQWHARRNVRVLLAESSDGVSVPPDAFAEHLSERTGVLATSHVYYTSGAIQDIAALSRMAREAGALSVVDAYQATGQVPTDVGALGCDVLVAGGLKWLLGGTGIAYLYVSRKAQARLVPELAGWFGDAAQFDFDVTRYKPRDDARRFELGTPALPSVHAGAEGLALVAELGVEAIRRRQTELVTDLVDRFVDAGFSLRTPVEPERRAGIVLVALEDPPAVVGALAGEGIIVDSRPGRLRVSPYFYNTPEENERVVAAVRRHCGDQAF